MRTRSQPMSPSGFVSLETPPRRTRSSTRAAASRQSASQGSTSEQTTEPATQPATRSKTQRTAKKPTTKKSTTATTETTTATKPQIRRNPRRATRKTPQNADDAASGEGQQSANDSKRETTQTDTDNNAEAVHVAATSAAVTSDDTALLEPKSSKLEEKQDISTTAPNEAEIDNIFKDLPGLGETDCPAWHDLTMDEIRDLGRAIMGAYEPEPLVLPDDLLAEIDEVLGSSGAQESEAAPAKEELAVAVEENTDSHSPTPVAVSDPTASGAVPNTEQAEPTAAEPKEPEQPKDEVAPCKESSDDSEAVSPLAPAVDSQEQTAVEDNLVEELVLSFEKLSLVDVVPSMSNEAAIYSTESTTAPAWQPEAEPVSEGIPVIASIVVPAALASGASVTPSMASIYDDEPPVFPGLPFLTPKRVEQRQPTLFLTPIPVTPSSIFDDGINPYLQNPEGQESVERPLAPVVLEEEPELIPGPPLCQSRVRNREPHTPPPRRGRSCTSVHTLLSPIPEELESDPGTSSSVGASQASEAAPVERPPITSSTVSQGSSSKGLRKPQKSQKKARQDKSLTSKKVNRKRAHADVSSDDHSRPESPSAKKRRNIGAPGSTPFARRLNSLPRGVPYSERLRRRRIESQGRIDKTVFRIPQLIAQTEADRLASEARPAPSPTPEPLQTDLDLPVEQAQTIDQTVSEQAAISQEPSTPEPTSRGWSIRGLLNSVPRSFSRLLPSFSRTPERPEVSAPQQPSSERVQRTQPSEADPTALSNKREPQPRRRLSEQPPAKRARNLSYSLFPSPIDRSLYLGDIRKETPKETPKPVTSAPAVQPSEKGTSQAPKSQDEGASISHNRGRGSTSQATGTTDESQKKKKRKRSPSPDVIPNPVGCSYGMDLDYFCYSSESEDEAEITPPQTEPRNADTLAKSALRNAIQSERPASKKVRFDASPDDTPSKIRARATDPYRGKHFVGMGSPQTLSAPPTPTPSTPTPTYRVVDPRSRPGFIPNKTGTYGFDYDDFSDSDSSGPSSPSSVPASTVSTPSAPAPSALSTPSVPATSVPTPSVASPSAIPGTPTFSQPGTSQGGRLPTPRANARPALPPSTPAKVDEEALARVRSQAEKYKPKTPSGLRTASRYSSPLTATPDITPNITPAPPAEKSPKEFGRDKFANDAQWLYEHCPSGDLSHLMWPAKQSLAESLNVRPESLRILSEIWDDSEVDNAYAIFKHGLSEFEKTLA